MIAAQLDTVLGDIGAGAAKTGMLSAAAIIATVAAGVRRHGLARLVADPVMVAKSGDRLLREDAVDALRSEPLPLALVVTLNIPEAKTLAGIPIRWDDDRREAARRIAAFGPRWVVIKGGHAEGDPVDVPNEAESGCHADRRRATDRHAKYARHRLHLRGRRHCRAGARPGDRGGGSGSEGVRDRRVARVVPGRRGSLAGPSLSRVVVADADKGDHLRSLTDGGSPSGLEWAAGKGSERWAGAGSVSRSRSVWSHQRRLRPGRTPVLLCHNRVQRGAVS